MYTQIGVLGTTGYGKTFLCEKLVKNQKRLICIDDYQQFNVGYVANSFNEFVDMINEKDKFKIRCVFYNEDDYEKLFFALKQIKNFTLLIDEISFFADQYSINEDLKEIVTRGRHNNISVVWNTQRPQMINRVLTSQAYNLIIFRLSDVSDIRYVWLDKNKIHSLKKREFMIQGEHKEIEKNLGIKFDEKYFKK
jgi:hypothetical protein